MKANVFYGPKDLRLEELAVPRITPEELLIRVEACAVCGSDLRTYNHGAHNITGPVIMGHEIAGTVVEAGAATSGFPAGQRVAVAPAVPCCECRYCQVGAPNMCDNLRSIGYEFNGGFAEYMVVPRSAVRAGCVNPIPGHLSFSDAAVAEPLACAVNAQELLQVALGDSVLILGAGPLGCLHSRLARLRGASKVILADLQPRRLELAAAFGADVLINPAAEKIETRVLEETGGYGASVVIVAAPSARAQEQGITLAAKRGRISFFGGLPKSDPIASVNANLVHYRELFVMGSYGSAPRHNRQAIELLAAGFFDVAKLIGMSVKLDGIRSGMDAMAAGVVLKVVVQP